MSENTEPFTDHGVFKGVLVDPAHLSLAQRLEAAEKRAPPSFCPVVSFSNQANPQLLTMLTPEIKSACDEIIRLNSEIDTTSLGTNIDRKNFLKFLNLCETNAVALSKNAVALSKTVLALDAENAALRAALEVAREAIHELLMCDIPLRYGFRDQLKTMVASADSLLRSPDAQPLSPP